MRTASFRRRSGAPPQVFGHRGVRGAAPENTMSAFELAAKAGAQGVELDVRVCGSGELVVCHDPTLDRVTSGRDRRVVADLDWPTLSGVDVGDGQHIPLLDEVLRWARDRNMKVNVEMKRDLPDRRAVVRETARALDRIGAQLGNVIVSSFDPWMLAHLGWQMPNTLRGYLFASGQRWARYGWAALPLRVEAVHPDKLLVDAKRCEKWRRRGKLVNVWTVNDGAEARSLAAIGVDAIVTDTPQIIVEALNSPRGGPKAAPSNSPGPKAAPSNSPGPKAAPSNSPGPKAAPSNSPGPKAAPS
ncbi:MAG TPA: glycerophosphodiester phosphodiesterase family protein, partial [Polyangiaceae bacterium]